MSDRNGNRANIDPKHQAKDKGPWPVAAAIVAIVVAGVASAAIAHQNPPSSPPSVTTPTR